MRDEHAFFIDIIFKWNFVYKGRRKSWSV